MMLSRTLPSLSRSIPTAVAGSSRSRSSHGLPIAHRARVPVPIVQALRSGRTYSTPAAPAAMDEGEKAIYEKLSAKFPGNRLEVQDVSGGCGSFYAILISSPAFKGLSTIKQHKLVNTCLKEDIKTIHGLQLKTIPEE